MRRAGVLLHPTSFSGGHGTGDFGPEARRFVDWLARAGVQLWQVLPLVPPGAGESPYSSTSAFALSPWLIDLRGLVHDGLLDASALAHAPDFAPQALDAAAMRAFKGPLLERAAAALLAVPARQKELDAYRSEHAWVDDYSLFVALKRAHDGQPFFRWPKGLRDRDADALAKARAEHADAVRIQAALQFLAERQWQALRNYAKERGISVVGDVPIYVDHDSAEVWCHRAAFQLGSDAMPRAVSGVPPDYFSESGQLWGNPLYDWAALKRQKHQLWVERMRRMYQLCDIVRIDHFRAFSAYWSVPAGDKDARGGTWMPGPGRAVFDDIRAALGRADVIAEDLGSLDADVHALRDGLGFPGMRVLQFAFGGEADNAYLPHNFVANAVAYTGTHDNDTTIGWWSSLDDKTKDHVRRYYGVDAHDIAWDLIRSALMSVADTAIVPLQDLLNLGHSARMNTPSAASGNWGWRMSEDALRPDVADRLRGLIELYRRSSVTRSAAAG
jgi:4-alpha-glucanotransferase